MKNQCTTFENGREDKSKNGNEVNEKDGGR